MNDIKSIVSVIKILERTIGILENCNDVGEISDTTRKRIIEMLNKATLEIYFLSDGHSSGQTSGTGTIPENEETVETPVISNDIEEDEDTDKAQPVAEKIIEDNISKTVDEMPADVVSEEEFVPEEETLTEEILEEKNSIENISEEITVPEDTIFDSQDSASEKPLFEWGIGRQEPEANNDNEINRLKFQLEEERKRLEQELQNWQDERRKRDEEILAAKKLLESLQQQAAANQVRQQPVPQQPAPQQSQPAPQQSQPAPQQFRPVSQQSQPVPQQSQPAPQQSRPVSQSQPIPQQSQPAPQQSRPVSHPNQSSRRVQQPQQQVKTEPIIRTGGFNKEPAKKEDAQETLIDRFIGTKKVLYENFESDNMVNQISTPVSSLPKAIGINDRFRFIKELFGGDSDLYNETIKILDTTGSLVSAISYIESNFSWDKNSDSVKQLISLIRRRYM